MTSLGYNKTKKKKNRKVNAHILKNNFGVRKPIDIN